MQPASGRKSVGQHLGNCPFPYQKRCQKCPGCILSPFLMGEFGCPAATFLLVNFIRCSHNLSLHLILCLQLEREYLVTDFICGSRSPYTMPDYASLYFTLLYFALLDYTVTNYRSHYLCIIIYLVYTISYHVLLQQLYTALYQFTILYYTSHYFTGLLMCIYIYTLIFYHTSL